MFQVKLETHQAEIQVEFFSFCCQLFVVVTIIA